MNIPKNAVYVDLRASDGVDLSRLKTGHHYAVQKARDAHTKGADRWEPIVPSDLRDQDGAKHLFHMSKGKQESRLVRVSLYPVERIILTEVTSYSGATLTARERLTLPPVAVLDFHPGEG